MTWGRFVWQLLPPSPCLRIFFDAGKSVLESRSWTESDRPKFCISIFRRYRDEFAREVRVKPCQVMNLRWSTMPASQFLPAPSEIYWSPDPAPHNAIGIARP